jgi:hypothetical protein
LLLFQVAVAGMIRPVVELAAVLVLETGIAAGIAAVVAERHGTRWLAAGRETTNAWRGVGSGEARPTGQTMAPRYSADRPPVDIDRGGIAAEPSNRSRLCTKP